MNKKTFSALSPNTYEVGVPSNNIILDTSISTVGVASTLVFLNSIRAENIITTSSGTTGEIVSFQIGTGESLKNTIVFVQSVINFAIISSDNLQQAINNTTMFNNLSGGLNGNQAFSSTDEQKQSFGNTLIITEQIQLT